MQRTTAFVTTAAAAILVLASPRGAWALEKSAEQLKAMLEARAEKLGGGYVAVGRARSGGMSEGQSVELNEMLRRGGCYRFLAVGGDKVADLDLRVFQGGRQVAGDQGPVPDPMAEHCAEADGEVKVRLQMYSGNGPYALQLYAQSQDAGTASQQEAAVALDLEEAAAEAAAGLSALGDPYVGTLGHRNAATFDVTLPEARCYKFLGAGGAGVQDLTLTVLVDGEEVAADRISGVRPAAQWCAPGRTAATIKVAMYGGAGAFAVGIYAAQRAATAPEKVGGNESDFIANRLRQLHAQFGKGRAAITPVVRGNLATNGEQVFTAKLTSGHCYTIIGAGSPSVKDLDVVLLDQAKVELQRDPSHDGFAVMDTSPCPRFTGNYVVKIRVGKGDGQFGAQVFSD
jgi:hypothetical protein